MNKQSAKIKEVASGLPAWLVIGLVGCIVVIESIVFLLPAPAEFPMDDAYIHFVYADNLLAHGKLFFSDMNETGIGATSPLWVFLLAGLKLLGIPLPISAKLMGIIGLIIVSGGIYSLFHPVWKSPSLLLAVFLVAISGNLIWFSLSGMETILFLALGILALIAYRQGRWKTLGVILGLTILTRPEGLVLVVAITVVDLWSSHRLRSGLIKAILIGVVIAAPWFIYLHLRTGYLLPSSAIGKRFTSTVSLNYVASQNADLARLIRYRSLVYPAAWLVYLLVFALGGKALPAPYIAQDNDLAIFSYSPSYWAIPIWLLIVLPILIAVGKWLFTRRQWSQRAKDHDARPLIILAVWFALHNLAYMFFLPMLGTASRYGALNHVILWLILAVGAAQFAHRPWLARFLTGGLLTIAFINNFYWNNVYDANLEHMRNVRIVAARFVRESLPANDRCAALDIGAIRYFSQRPIVDLGVLIDPEEQRWIDAGKSDLYIIEQGATCIILPGRTNVSNDGWYDIAEIAGLNDSPYFKIQQIAMFEMDHERWLLGYLPTGNQHKSVVIYKIVQAPP